MSETNYSRSQAADLLGISTRTLDRYLKAKKIKSKEIKGHVRIYQTELEKLAEEIGKKIITEENIITPVQKQAKSKEIISHSIHGHDLIYKNLYEETKAELKDAYGQLQMVNYQLGQFEEKLKNSVPLLAQKNEEKELETAKQDLEKKSQEIEQKLKIERLNKWIFAILLFGILILQPILWLASK